MNDPSAIIPVTSFLFHLWGPLRDTCFLYTNARNKYVISYIKMHVLSLISLSSSPSGKSLERVEVGNCILLLWIKNINILCSTVHPHLAQVDYSTLKHQLFFFFSLRDQPRIKVGLQMCWGSCPTCLFNWFHLVQCGMHKCCLKPLEVWI